MKMKRFINKEAASNYYYFDGTYTKNEVPSDYVYEDGDEKYDYNEKFRGKDTSTRDWTSDDSFETRKSKQFFSWKDLSEDEKKALVNKNPFIKKIADEYLSSAVSTIKGFVEKTLKGEFELKNSDFNINYDRVFDVNVIINFTVDDYTYETKDGVIIYTDEEDLDIRDMIANNVKDTVSFVYKMMTKAIEENYEDHVYTEEEKETLRRTSRVFKRKLSRLAKI